MLYKEPDEIEQIENLPSAEKYYNQFIDRNQIFRKKDPTVLDGMICLFSFIFDLNFEFSKKSIVEGNYINDILNRFNFKNEQTKMQIEEIKKISCEFLK